jgi:hypothetical protein
MTIHKQVQDAEAPNWVYSYISNREAPQILKRPLQIQMTQQNNIVVVFKHCLSLKIEVAQPFLFQYQR